MILSHERPPGATTEMNIRFDLIDTISTVALKWVLVSRGEKKPIRSKFDMASYKL